MQLTLLLCCLPALVVAAYLAKAKNNVAAYWGQGSNQENLALYCAQGTFDIVLLSFLNVVTPSEVGFNFGNGCHGAECPFIARDIKICQSLGIKVLLSMGGDRSFGNFNLETDEGGRKAAKLVYDMFNRHGDKNVIKPFGDAQVDGFDLDVENHIQDGQIAFYAELRRLWGKNLLLSACPQCTFPDPNVQKVMESKEVMLDIVMMQFYSNLGCSVTEENFDGLWRQWSDFFESVPNKNIKMYVTLQGAEGNPWHASLSHLKSQMKGKMDSKIFAGFGVWDATVATKTQDKSLGTSMSYLQGLKMLASRVYG